MTRLNPTPDAGDDDMDLCAALGVDETDLTQDIVAAAMGSWVPQMAEIVSEVSSMTGIPMSDMCSKSRRRFFVRARQLAMWQGHRLGLSMPQIGDFFGYDHTTVLHGIRQTQARIDASRRSGSIKHKPFKEDQSNE